MSRCLTKKASQETELIFDEEFKPITTTDKKDSLQRTWKMAPQNTTLTYWKGYFKLILKRLF